MTENYYVVQTHPCQERLALTEMEEARFETCWLASKEKYRSKTGWREMDVPTFPSYIFVSFDVRDERWRSITQMRGVKRILGSDPMHPTQLPIGAIDKLKARFDAGEFKVRAELPIAVLDRVRIDAGPFAGHVGLCTMSRGERIKILMQVLGDVREIEVWSGVVKRDARREAMAV